MATFSTQIWQDDYEKFERWCKHNCIAIETSTRYGYYHLVTVEGTIAQMEQVIAVRKELVRQWRSQHSWLRLTVGPFFGFQNIY